MNMEQVKEALRRKKEKKCAICGKVLNQKEISIDYLVPLSKGGEIVLGNMQLLCRTCNSLKARHSKHLLGYQFEEYIVQLLNLHPAYTIIERNKNVQNRMIDLFFKKENEGDYLAEIKISTSYTRERLDSVIAQLCECKREFPTTTLVFIVFGELSQNYVKLLSENKIVIWDRKFLVKEFRSEIEKMKDSDFSQMILENIEDDDEFATAIKELKECPSGKDSWGKYQKLIEKILELLFVGELDGVYAQKSDEYQKNRRDYIMANYAQGGIWNYLRERYCADYIVVDAKNSGKYIQKSDMLQIGHYLKADGSGLFGIIIARKGLGETAKYAQRELWMHDKKMVIVLNDDDVEQMLLEKKNNNDPAKIIRKKIEDFRLAI